ncbi:Oidioi.mRNA.OKI2018_I69.XSR.g13455.t1.cds [Oikopleura dioica]|uniref:Oidioi.mRNA.OKI2018_I69.XSR.g13455.t1.cds n=1 Tax=Oikopleura dioica TaxID=34765 RepID=A0ABN7S6Y1_OIKDI|nr:Oidioi.mRNA.OKI2018_I69.XSR.g13455.t1.cds [Oikopleura dioica]
MNIYEVNEFKNSLSAGIHAFLQESQEAFSVIRCETANSLVSFDWTCTCSELSDWFRKFYAWEPLEWYLNTLRRIGTDCGNEECCDVYKNECENRMYNMAGLFDNIYDRSCKSQCQPASRGINDEHSVTRSRMCYDSMIEIEKEARNSSIWFDDQVPFAGLQFCQINGDSSYSPWTCLDSSAKASLIVCCIIISLMALASVVSNILVLKIYCSRKRLRSAIGYRWRISFAISDLLVGLVVLPSAVYNIYLRYMKRSLSRWAWWIR